MAEPAIVVATRAEERAQSAHKRLDGINGSINRLNDKVDILDGKLDTVILGLAARNAADAALERTTEKKATKMYYLLQNWQAVIATGALVVAAYSAHWIF